MEGCFFRRYDNIIINYQNFQGFKTKKTLKVLVFGEKRQSVYCIMHLTKFFNRKMRELSDQNSKVKTIQKESQGSCPVDNVNVFSQGLDDSGCQIFFLIV